MAVTHGKSGKAQVGANTVAAVKSWRMEYDPQWVDKEYLGDSYGSQLDGVHRGRGTVVCETDLTDTDGQVAMRSAVTGATTVALLLYLTSASYWSFNAHLDLVDEVDIGAITRRTFNFRNDGTISYT